MIPRFPKDGLKFYLMQWLTQGDPVVASAATEFDLCLGNHT